MAEKSFNQWLHEEGPVARLTSLWLHSHRVVHRMALCIRKGGIDAIVVAAALGWTVLCVVWLLGGSGYQFIQPTAYELTTRFLLSNPVTAADALETIQAQGYLSLIEQHRLLSKTAQ